MTRRLLLGYQLLTGVSETGTGAMLILAPEFTLGLMGVHVPPQAIPFLSFIGAFVYSVGLACCYGAWLICRASGRARMEMVWLLTAFTRSAVAIFVAERVMTGSLEAAWLTVAVCDGVCVLIQAVGLRRRWLAHAIAE
jgi:hypothetical protein